MLLFYSHLVLYTHYWTTVLYVCRWSTLFVTIMRPFLYGRESLYQLRNKVINTKLKPSIYKQLKELNIAKQSSRGCRAGRNKRRPIQVCITNRADDRTQVNEYPNPTRSNNLINIKLCKGASSNRVILKSRNRHMECTVYDKQECRCVWFYHQPKIGCFSCNRSMVKKAMSVITLPLPTSAQLFLTMSSTSYQGLAKGVAAFVSSRVEVINLSMVLISLTHLNAWNSPYQVVVEMCSSYLLSIDLAQRRLTINSLMNFLVCLN